MNEEELDKHGKELDAINSLKIRDYYLNTLTKIGSHIPNHSNGGIHINKANPIALAHDYLESDFRDKILDMEEQIYNGSLGLLKVKNKIN